MEAHGRWSPSGYSDEWWLIPPLVKRVSTKSNPSSCSCVGKVAYMYKIIYDNHTLNKKKVMLFCVFSVVPYLYICVNWNILERWNNQKALASVTIFITLKLSVTSQNKIKITVSKGLCFLLGQHTQEVKKKWHGLTESRSFKPAPRVNFLAKRKQGASFPLLVHHSLLFSVS
jgi:hypothetical protein